MINELENLSKQTELNHYQDPVDEFFSSILNISLSGDYSGTDRYIWKGTLDLHKDNIKALSPEDKEELIKDLFLFLRTNGFPYPSHSKKELIKDWKSLKEKTIQPNDKGFISNKSRAGMDLCQHFSAKEFYSVSSNKDPSMLEAFNDDKTLKAVLSNRWIRYPEYFNCHSAMIRQGFRSTRSCANISNFNCLLAKYFYETYSKPYDWVYDYSKGFGQRMVAALSCKRNYCAVDPWLAQIESGVEIHKFLKEVDSEWLSDLNLELIGIGSEIYCPENQQGKFSLAFSSPPYVSKEVYDKGSETQSIHNRSYEDWLNDWWFKTVSNISELLKPDGYFILNMVSVLDGKYKILEDMLKIADKFGFKFVKEYNIEMSKGHFAKYKKKDEVHEDEEEFLFKKEPVIVMNRMV